MCGIIGAVCERSVTPLLWEGLQRLEYRGYDSLGLAVLGANGLERVRRTGKISELAGDPAVGALSGRVGIAHTRWATHGAPSEDNAHPHMSGSGLALVHNGIIDNHGPLRALQE
ncbi:MAG TPA: hypothetical protein VKA14_07065, partial [Gammaproteobacteria bacterium]|nr:hypothetical protein [Gammaproteobacteria bacterium]